MRRLNSKESVGQSGHILVDTGDGVYFKVPKDLDIIIGGSTLSTENLDDIKSTGVYYQPSNANATLARNYPMTNAGRLTVDRATNDNWVYQEYTIYSQSWPKTFRRNLNSSTWGAWRLQVDELVLNDRLSEQDTGDRDITSLVPDLVAGSGHWTIRRVGMWVYMNLYNLTFTPTSGSLWQQSAFVPLGFRPPAASQYVRFPAARASTSETTGPFRVDRYGGVTIYNVNDGIVHVTVSWPTNDAFPTTLPGTPA